MFVLYGTNTNIKPFRFSFFPTKFLGKTAIEVKFKLPPTKSDNKWELISNLLVLSSTKVVMLSLWRAGTYLCPIGAYPQLPHDK